MKHRVYCMRMRGTPYRKIGVSNRPKARLSSVQTGNPLPVDLEWSEPMDSRDSAYATEKKIHRSLREFRAKGEWFCLSDDGSEWAQKTATGKDLPVPVNAEGCESHEWKAVREAEFMRWSVRDAKSEVCRMQKHIGRIEELIYAELPGVGRLDIDTITNAVRTYERSQRMSHRLYWMMRDLEEEKMRALWAAYKLDKSRKHPNTYWMTLAMAEQISPCSVWTLEEEGLLEIEEDDDSVPVRMARWTKKWEREYTGEGLRRMNGVE